MIQRLHINPMAARWNKGPKTESLLKAFEGNISRIKYINFF